MKCDFCCAILEKARRYRAKTFVQPAVVQITEGGLMVSGGVRSIGDWAACETCAKLIDALDYDTLVDRAADAQLMRGSDLPRPVLVLLLRGYYDEFQKNRIVSTD